MNRTSRNLDRNDAANRGASRTVDPDDLDLPVRDVRLSTPSSVERITTPVPGAPTGRS